MKEFPKHIFLQNITAFFSEHTFFLCRFFHGSPENIYMSKDLKH